MGNFQLKETLLNGLNVITPITYKDLRGEFSKVFCHNEFEDLGLESRITDINTSTSSKRGTIRGMHYQIPPNSEDKLIRCLNGAILDVALDIREDSPTFLEYHAEELTKENGKMLYIPKGFAHGFLTLKDNSTVVYAVTNSYNLKSERIIRWNDPRLNISWPIKDEPIQSEKDSRAPLLESSFKGIVI